MKNLRNLNDALAILEKSPLTKDMPLEELEQMVRARGRWVPNAERIAMILRGARMDYDESMIKQKVSEISGHA